jgi:magnesium-transporting ATPase (P-type)
LAGIQAGLNKTKLDEQEPKVDELQFDPVYKYSATLRKIKSGDYVLSVLGAPEIVLEMSKYLDHDGRAELLSYSKKQQLGQKYEELAVMGQRVLYSL